MRALERERLRPRVATRMATRGNLGSANHVNLRTATAQWHELSLQRLQDVGSVCPVFASVRVHRGCNARDDSPNWKLRGIG